MATLWIYEIHVFVPSAILVLANTYGAQIDPDAGGGKTFMIPLSPSGAGLPTYYACRLTATETMRAAMHSVLIGNVLVGLQFFRVPKASNTLELTNNLSAQSQTGQPWTWAQSLSTMGLKVIAPSGI